MSTNQHLYKILIVDDDLTYMHVIKSYLENNDFAVETLDSGEHAVSHIIKTQPDAVILDGLLPHKDGFDICREVRVKYHGTILMLTGRDETIDQVVGLELGADGYLVKPVTPRLLLAHLHAHLRKTRNQNEPTQTHQLTFGGLTIDASARSAHLHGVNIELTSAEFDLLWLLASHAGHVVSRDELFESVLGTENDGLNRSIDMMVSRLRKRLHDDNEKPRRIKTVRVKGYLFSPTDWS
jgi:two-component system OmpR family response regulator